ncbi:MAG: bifunctional 5,10-methylenetetrahydrofolate dehydrogenase/5,10-methenyltetrahydrofolate cyclohydrolase [bacterium]
MQAKIINGKFYANKTLAKLKVEVKKLKAQKKLVKLAVILIGNDKSSISFIKKKEKACQQIGIDFQLYNLSKNSSPTEIIKTIKTAQKNVNGLIVQLPIPGIKHPSNILDNISCAKDVDCLTTTNLGKLTSGHPRYLPPTASAVMEIFRKEKISLIGKHIVMVGKGDLVGKPLAILLTQDKVTLTICNRYTKNLAFHTKQADILISAVGIPKLITKNMIKAKAVVIDAGISFKGKNIYGDVEWKKALAKAAKITPVPGGVGPLTVAELLKNVVQAASK